MSIAMPPGTVQAPNRCSTYGVTPTQAGTSRGSWPSATNGWAAISRSRSSLRSLHRRCSVSRLSSRAASGGGRRSGSQGARGTRGAAPPSRRRTTRRGRPSVPRPSPSSSTAAICAAANRRQPYRRAVLEAVLTEHLERHQIELALDRAAGLRNRSAGPPATSSRRPRVPGEPVGLHVVIAPPSRSARSSNVTSCPKLASRAATAMRRSRPRPPSSAPCARTSQRGASYQTGRSGATRRTAQATKVRGQRTSAGWCASETAATITRRT